MAVQAFLNTFLAAAAAGLSWGFVEKFRDGKFTNLGVASGIVAGLVAITPGAGFVAVMSPIWIGLATGVICCFAVGLKTKAGYDDALDVVGVHFVGGLVGSLAIGFYRRPGVLRRRVPGGGFYGGGLELLGVQALANGAVIIYSFVVTALIMLALKATIGVRVSEDIETSGLDLAERAERPTAPAAPLGRALRKDWGMKLIIAFIKPFKLEQARDSLKTAGVSGMSVSDVSGFGRQGGQTEVYRGAEYEVEFVPKVRLEVIVTDELAGPAVAAIESAAHTGEIGDGKIVVVPVKDVVRIRTSERGADAI